MRHVRRCGALASIAVFLIAWEFLARFTPLANPLFPPPTRVALTFTNQRFLLTLAVNYGYTAVRALAGFALGLAAGIALGVALSAKGLSSFVQPIATIFFAIPSVAWIPLLIVWMGVKEMALPITASFLCSFPPVLYGTINAFRTADREEVDVALVLGARPTQVMKDIILPQALMKVIPVVKAEAVMSWKTVFVSEMVALSSGLGYLAMTYSSTLEVADLLAVISVLALTTLALIEGLDRVEATLVRRWLGGDSWSRSSYGP
ncbi:MAG: ABC transporter permease subunit [Desulfurococcales archaeon]|nr:ABC transporter permease subunit [Desulfurococcales archaeon]